MKAMGAATASSGAIGLYHVENLTPDAVDNGRDLLVKDYQTYVIDDKEIEPGAQQLPEPVAQKRQEAESGLYRLPPQHLSGNGQAGAPAILDALKKRGLRRRSRFLLTYVLRDRGPGSPVLPSTL